MNRLSSYCAPDTLQEPIGRLFPGLGSIGKLRPDGCGVELTQMRLHQAEGLLNEFMQLVDPSERVDADDAEDLFAPEGKIGRGDVHLLDQSVDPLKPRIVNTIESHEHQEDM